MVPAGESIRNESLLPPLPSPEQFDNPIVADIFRQYWGDTQYVHLEDALLPVLEESDSMELFKAKDWFANATWQIDHDGVETTILDKIFDRKQSSFAVTEGDLIVSHLCSLESFKQNLTSEIAAKYQAGPRGVFKHQDVLQNEIFFAMIENGVDYHEFVAKLLAEEKRRDALRKDSLASV